MLDLAPAPPWIAPVPPPSLYRLPDLSYLRLRVALRALEPARLPPFRGSLLRGAFGHALRRAVCTVGPAQACASCRLRFECAYARIFETPLEPGAAPPSLRGQVVAPHPYVFESPVEAGEVRAGAPLIFDLLLFGDAIAHQARVLLAIERMGAFGLGSARARFELARAEVLGPGARTPLFVDGAWVGGAPVRGGPLPSAPLPGFEPLDGTPEIESGFGAAFGSVFGSAPEPAVRKVRLRFLTPLRIRRENRLVAPRDPRDLIYQMLRRVLEVAHVHTREPRIDWTFRPLLDAASALDAPEWRFRLVRLARYSNRQQSTLDLDGYVGTAVLAGDLAPFTALLRAAEVLHVGKGTVFGLGQVALEAVREERSGRGRDQ